MVWWLLGPKSSPPQMSIKCSPKYILSYVLFRNKYNFSICFIYFPTADQQSQVMKTNEIPFFSQNIVPMYHCILVCIFHEMTSSSNKQQHEFYFQAPPKNHAVGDILIVVKLESTRYMVHMLHFDGKLIKIIKEHMY